MSHSIRSILCRTPIGGSCSLYRCSPYSLGGLSRVSYVPCLSGHVVMALARCPGGFIVLIGGSRLIARCPPCIRGGISCFALFGACSGPLHGAGLSPRWLYRIYGNIYWHFYMCIYIYACLIQFALYCAGHPLEDLYCRSLKR